MPCGVALEERAPPLRWPLPVRSPPGGLRPPALFFDLLLGLGPGFLGYLLQQAHYGLHDGVDDEVGVRDDLSYEGENGLAVLEHRDDGLDSLRS